eukprot:Gb_09994 [translate_table: standard]
MQAIQRGKGTKEIPQSNETESPTVLRPDVLVETNKLEIGSISDNESGKKAGISPGYIPIRAPTSTNVADVAAQDPGYNSSETQQEYKVNGHGVLNESGGSTTRFKWSHHRSIEKEKKTPSNPPFWAASSTLGQVAIVHTNAGGSTAFQRRSKPNKHSNFEQALCGGSNRVNKTVNGEAIHTIGLS